MRKGGICGLMLEDLNGYQWTAWLTHTRPHPPTLEELQADLERQRRVLFNAAMIEAREREEVARVAAAQQQTVRIQAPAAEGVRVSAEPKRPAEMSPSETARVDTAADRREPATEQPSPWKPPPSDEPHSWQPRAAVSVLGHGSPSLSAHRARQYLMKIPGSPQQSLIHSSLQAATRGPEVPLELGIHDVEGELLGGPTCREPGSSAAGS
ncbi:hypothetical protein ONZ51_g7489 [Trametes cubensis]|uniref:Uncharacterized protein n=1 Tax=Trametes cubensis TaxID=1111947 RepID=A0AAD7TQD3_9APHY|nr:hypothetical protein ONZ51_g7489 [Trametes cubensis]